MRRERGAWLLRLGREPEALGELERARLELPDDPRLRRLREEALKTAMTRPTTSALLSPRLLFITGSVLVLLAWTLCARVRALAGLFDHGPLVP